MRRCGINNISEYNSFYNPSSAFTQYNDYKSQKIKLEKLINEGK